MSFINWLTGKKTLRRGKSPEWVTKSKSLRETLSQKREKFIKQQKNRGTLKKKRNEKPRNMALRVKPGASIPKTQSNRKNTRNSRRRRGMNNNRSLNARKFNKKTLYNYFKQKAEKKRKKREKKGVSTDRPNVPLRKKILQREVVKSAEPKLKKITANVKNLENKLQKKAKIRGQIFGSVMDLN